MKNTIIIGALLLLIIGFTGCTNQPTEPTLPTNIISTTTLTASQELKQFNDINELKDFLSKQSTESNVRNEGIYSRDVMMKAAAPNMNSLTAESNGKVADYSQTNNQITNVDEADFIKNDNQYIYMITNNELVIIDAQDPKTSNIISKTKIMNDSDYNYYRVRELFLNKDKVIVFTDNSEETFYLNQYDIMPITTQKQNTDVKIYDVTNKSTPKLEEEFTISGQYYSSRMINDTIYIVSQEGLYNWQHYVGPMVKSTKMSLNSQIYYFDNQEQNYQMNTITSINTNTNEVVDTKSIMLGYSNTLMVSENNIYIAYQKQNYWCFGWRCTSQEIDNKERFTTVIVPLLKGDIRDKVDNILNQKLSEDKEWEQISIELNKFYTELKNNESMQKDFEKIFITIEDALNEYDAKKAPENSKTIIHRFSINKGEINYESKGEVEGRLLNQFSLDEYNNNLRVATTTDVWLNRGRIQYNNIFVLNNNLKTIGTLKNLAENESIYSTRFMQDKVYLVTFRQIDPFFVIDLSNPKNPEVLGYLKIPGYSSYLHPIDNNLIIGVGKETGENEYGGITTKGVKISLFDVSDFNKPKELDKYEIGLSGTDSSILSDHKAFLYSETKNMLVIPVSEVTDRAKSGQYDYRTSVMNGAYVFKIKDNKLVLDAKIKHSSIETEYYYWMNEATVTRSLYIDNALYTISDKYIKVNDIANDFDELNSIELSVANNNYNNNEIIPVMY